MADGFWNKVRRTLRLSEQPATLPDAGLRRIEIHTEPRSSHGTEIFSGYPNEEYLQALTGTKRADEFDKMRRSDYQITMLLSAVANVIKSATWEIEAGVIEGEQATDDAKADRDLISQILLKDAAPGFDQFISEALTMGTFGHSVFEVIHKGVVGHKKFGSYTSLASLQWISPRTIERWIPDPQTGTLLAIEQQANGDLARHVEIPAKFLLVMTLNREGANYEGISLIRPCYGPYKRKDMYLRLNAIGVEKYAVPTPMVELPTGEEDTTKRAKLVQTLEKYTSHQSNYLIYPKGYKIELHSNVYDPAKVEVSIDNEDKRMTKAFIANFLELGMGSSSGSWSLSTDLSDFFLSGLKHLANIICLEVNNKLIPSMVRMNRGEREVYPQLKCSGIDDKAGKELAEVLEFLARNKYVVPDDNLEVHLRKRYGLPAVSKEGQRIVQAAGAFGQQSFVPGSTDPGVDVQKQALNGAQVASLVSVVNQVSIGMLPRESALEIITTAFQLTREEADLVLGSAGKGFVAKIPEQANLSLAERIRLAEAKRLERFRA